MGVSGSLTCAGNLWAKISAMLLIFSGLAIFVGCSIGGHPIVGKWREVQDMFPESFEFRSDGTMEITNSSNPPAILKFHWEPKDDTHFYMLSDWQIKHKTKSDPIEFSFQENKLVLKYSSGITRTFERF